jgi:AcrR family transcriptional regulator
MHSETSLSCKPKQRRSLDATRRMLEAGRELLNHKDIDQISVQEIVKNANASIGSFYHHFENKDRFFQTLVREMADKREAVAMANYGDTPIEELPEVLVRGAIENHRLYRGLLRSAIRQHLSGAPVWEPITIMGQNLAAEYIRRLELHLQRPLAAAEQERVAFAFLWLYGILAQSVLGLNTLSDYRIPDELFEQETTKTFSSILRRALSAE